MWNRLMAGLHPATKGQLDKPRRLRQMALAAAPTQAGQCGQAGGPHEEDAAEEKGKASPATFQPGYDPWAEEQEAAMFIGTDGDFDT